MVVDSAEAWLADWVGNMCRVYEWTKDGLVSKNSTVQCVHSSTNLLDYSPSQT